MSQRFSGSNILRTSGCSETTLPLNDGDDGHELDQKFQKFFYLDLMAFDTLAFGALAFFLLAILDDPEPGRLLGKWRRTM